MYCLSSTIRVSDHFKSRLQDLHGSLENDFAGPISSPV